MENQNTDMSKSLAPFNGLLITLSFLTRLPVRALGYDSLSWKWSPAFFPLAGYVLGIIATSPFILQQNVKFGNGIGFELATPFLYLAILYWMNRMLHLDGFCDCCDGFSAMTDSKEKRLEIMKDPCVGSSAAGAAILLIGGKGLMLFILVWQYGATFVSGKEIVELTIALIATPAIARFAVVLLAFRAQYPREKGTGSVIVGNVEVWALVIALLSLAPILIYVDYAVVKIMLSMVGLNVIYWRKKADHMLGGVTGDVLGACCETTELSVLFGLMISL